eukprot:NODE_144_length_15804_cov_0.729131.p11 type:complete len:130 gc:universal NODE_144_length_15804_cov_0.729131:1983-1594(-)
MKLLLGAYQCWLDLHKLSKLSLLSQVVFLSLSWTALQIQIIYLVKIKPRKPPPEKQAEWKEGDKEKHFQSNIQNNKQNFYQIVRIPFLDTLWGKHFVGKNHVIDRSFLCEWCLAPMSGFVCPGCHRRRR